LRAYSPSTAGLSRSQRKLARLVFVDGVSIDQAAREAQMSYYRMCRMLKRALRIMREESNLRGMTATVGGHCGVRERTAANIAV
jgi:DNA-directed RNA polymerase specialized sigma24 family protein